VSLYADYLLERTFDHIVETDKGFATYRFLNESQVYIVDLFVLPQYRKTYVASDMADIIVEIAKQKGCTELIGTVVPSTKGSNTSLQTLLAYGMTLKSADKDLIIFKKDI
jgi:hypothetical protein